MADGGGRAAKRPKLLGEDEVWKPAGENVNLIEANGKSCTHEVGAVEGRRVLAVVPSARLGVAVGLGARGCFAADASACLRAW